MRSQLFSKWSIKKFIVFEFILFGTLYVFQYPISNLVNWIIVDKVLSKIPSGYFTDSYFLVTSGLLGYFLYRKSEITFQISLFKIILPILLAFRFSDIWVITCLKILPFIGYIDVFVLTYFVSLICSIYNFLISKKPNKKIYEIQTSGFIGDDPILYEADDFYNRKVTANRIADLIVRSSTNSSFAISVNGPYGSGKTSFINLISNGLNKYGNDDLIIKIQFDPWSFDNKADLAGIFLEQLIEKLAEVEPTLSAVLLSYLKKITKLEPGMTSLVGRMHLFSHFIFGQAINERERIELILQKLDRKIIVFIDDLDRLQPLEVWDIFRIIRNTVNFSKFYYVVAFDREYAITSLEKINLSYKDVYLEKIFQLEVPLPKIEIDKVYDVLKDRLKLILDDSDYNELDHDILPHYFELEYEQSLQGIFENARGVTRFVNSLIISYPLIKDEIVFKEFFFLELLKFKYPGVYDALYEHKELFLIKKQVAAAYKERLFLKISINEEGSHVAFTQVLKTACGSDFSNSDAFLIFNLFSHLFSGPFSSKQKGENSVTNPAAFGIYFKYFLGKMDLSERQFKFALKGGIKQLGTFVKDSYNRGLGEKLIKRFLIVDRFSSKQEFENYLNILFQLASRYTEDEGVTAFPYQILIDKLSDYPGDLKKLYANYSTKYQKFIKGLFSNYENSLFFLNQLIFEIKRNRKIEDYGTIREFSQIQVGYFKELVNSNHGLSEKVVWMFWGIREFNKDDGKANDDDFGYLVDDSIAILKRALFICDLSAFLKSIIQNSMHDENKYSISNMVFEQIFIDKEELLGIVRASENTSESTKSEFVDFYRKLENAGFSPVEFNFESLVNKGITSI
ncbi:KAP family NTPase [Algoriphagus sp. AGSA1]|uniref:KAP family P-loop NTPase fold protein n=1 Tax=Algoriphagus sp. AGSA1 TaxID=2907213 RepID=UPI001F342323|nr:P-loop NTPase fold protein [Algoriphagus sp. AGSA1]MCE7054715.1 KAP family NTPase [Algoriphagus sp. AGSA1]